MKFTQIPTDTFKKLQMNAGVLLRDFNPKEGTVQDTSIVGATTGGVNFTATAEFTDFGEDIDNCPENTKELKKKGYTTAACSGNFVTVDPKAAADLIGGAEVDGADGTHIIPHGDLANEDFKDLWIVGDYSDVNADGKSDGKAGFIAIHMMNSLSTGGFALQTTKNNKGQFAFEFTAHYSIAEQDKVPFELFISAGKKDTE